MSQVDKLPGEWERCWLKWPAKDKRPPIRLRGYGGKEGRVTMEGLTEKEIEAIKSFVVGTSYIRCVDGRMYAYDVMEEMPSPEQDPIIGPHWKNDGEVKKWGGIPDDEGWHSPGLIVTGVGAGCIYDCDRERSKERLESYGFVCLRSRRSRDGKFWEQWVLHFLEAARGELEMMLEDLPKEISWHDRAEAAARFVAKNAHFGSLDITIQRWALSYH